MCVTLDTNAILKYHKIQKSKDKHGKQQVGKKIRKGDQREIVRNFIFLISILI